MLDMPTTLRGERVTLARWDESHIPVLTDIVALSRDHIAEWMPHAAVDVDDPRRFVEGVLEFWEAGRVCCYAVTDARGAVVGHLSLTPSGRSADIAYWIRKERTREGLASAAVQTLIEALVTRRVDLDLLEITCDAGNLRSCRVAAKAGFRQVEARRREPITPAQTGVELLWRRPLTERAASANTDTG